MQKDVETQKLSQDTMARHLQELVALQHEYNVIIQNQCEELKRQNIAQKNELKKQKIWNWITYGITTTIAVASVVATFIGIFKSMLKMHPNGKIGQKCTKSSPRFGVGLIKS